MDNLTVILSSRYESLGNEISTEESSIDETVYLSDERGIGYKQQPGEFAAAADIGKIRQITDLYDPAVQLKNIDYNLKLDAKRLKYEVKEYTLTSGILPQFGTSSRLVALVTDKGGNLYHFYMQHSDGTWSHKQGVGIVTNHALDDNNIDAESIDTDGTTDIVLTNENIYKYANSGRYKGGKLAFYTITKPAIIDYPHEKRDISTTDTPPQGIKSQTKIIYKDMAGDYFETAINTSANTISGVSDFLKDEDFYKIVRTNGEYSITLNDQNNFITVYNYDRKKLNRNSNGKYTLSSGNIYFVKVSMGKERPTNYTIKIAK